MRINKELQSLSKHFEITYIGVGSNNLESFAAEYCKYFYLVIGRRNHPLTILKQFWIAWRQRKFHDSIHIINEQLMIFFYPLLFKKHVVLDIFDSIFLTMNKGGEKWAFIKRIVYAPIDQILVTDENRKALMPSFTHPKIKVLENYPNRYTGPIRKKQSSAVTILYNGWMGVNRGTEIVEKLLQTGRQFKILMAGWFSDQRSRRLTVQPNVEFRGVMTQREALRLAATEADYILCVYAPINENNINASPNKIYDAIQTRTPVIINREVRISGFVETHKIGVITDTYYVEDPTALADQLFALKNSFTFNENLVATFTWENIEHILIDSHKP